MGELKPKLNVKPIMRWNLPLELLESL